MSDTKISEAVERLERAYIAGMDEEFRDDLRVVLDSLTQPAELAEQQGVELPPLPSPTHESVSECGPDYFDASQMRQYARAALAETGKQQVGEDWSLIANEWADAATNGVQWLRNIRDGASTVDEALACMESNVARIQQLKPQQVGEVLGDALWWLQDAINTMAEGGNETHTEKLQALHDALAARQPGAHEPLIRQIADSLDAFWNPALGAIQQASHHGPASGYNVIGAIAQGFAAMAQQLRENATAPAKGIDLGPVRELLRRRIAQWRTHLPSDPGTPGTVAISGDGEGGYNNDVRMYREGIALMDQVLALIDNPLDAAPGVE